MAFKWKKLADPPAPDEVEVTVIGPGYGECIVVHTGRGRWLIVDSCRDPQTKQPVALKYLQAIGIDPAASVDWVVATHWHADHVGGISEIVAACTNAEFVCATVLRRREFIEYAALSRAVTGAVSGSEFLDALKIINGRGGQVRWTQGGRVLCANVDSGGQPVLRIEALSPSDREYELFLDRVASQKALKGKAHRAQIAFDPNHAAIVLSLQWASEAVLLGADLVSESDPARGWLAAVAQAKNMATVRGSLVKIPHHGSHGAHCPEMWSELLLNLPNAVITPYGRGRLSGRPPKHTDLARISKLSSRTVLTAPTNPNRSRKKHSPIAVGLKQSGIKMYTRNPKIGIARFRRYGVAQWNLGVFGQARKY